MLEFKLMIPGSVALVHSHHEVIDGDVHRTDIDCGSVQNAGDLTKVHWLSAPEILQLFLEPLEKAADIEAVHHGMMNFHADGHGPAAAVLDALSKDDPR